MAGTRWRASKRQPWWRRAAARGPCHAAIDDEFLRALGDFGIEIVHQHAHRRFGEPRFATDLRPTRASNMATVVQPVHSVLAMRMQARRMRYSASRTSVACAS